MKPAPAQPVAWLPEEKDAGLYVHIPHCRRKCGYCAFYSVPPPDDDGRSLVAALLRELADYDLRSVRTLYVGGGSPTCLSEARLQELVEALRAACGPVTEFTVECNPGEVTVPRLRRLLRAGVTRLSFGVQSCDDRDLQQLGRAHTAATADAAIRMARKAGAANVGIDLIFAIPGSTRARWHRTLDHALSLEVEHLAAYSLSYEPGTPLARAVAAGTLVPVDEDTDRQLYLETIERLTAAGYRHYEISNFARPGFACRHNLGTWAHRPYLGIGPAAASDWQGLRRRNVADVTAYLRALKTGQRPWAEVYRPDGVERLCERAVLGLRTRDGIDPEAFRRRSGHDFWQTFGTIVATHQRQGLLTLRAGHVRLTDAALPIADTVLCDFAAL